MNHHTQPGLFFVILIETGFHHVGQAGLKLLTSGYPPTLASQTAVITGISYRAQPAHSFSNRVSHVIRAISGWAWWLTPVIPAL